MDEHFALLADFSVSLILSCVRFNRSTIYAFCTLNYIGTKQDVIVKFIHGECSVMFWVRLSSLFVVSLLVQLLCVCGCGCEFMGVVVVSL